SQVGASNLTAELLGGNLYLVRGRAEPGTTIRVSGRETIVNPDGSFQIQLIIPAGTREVTVEAQDPQGNSSQYKVTLTGRTARGRT
ncbi:MAG TPA: Ig-like domain-containing protein, partial [Pyrinomonadaceae bacterium]|nr:Ig-like domain-containing protein [Pyrinomonadaceae bacterium]